MPREHFYKKCREGGLSTHGQPCGQPSSFRLSTLWITSGGIQGAETMAGALAAHPGYPALVGAATACHVPPG